MAITDPLIQPMWRDHPMRGILPQEIVFAALDPAGEPVNHLAYEMAQRSALTAYLLGFDVKVMPRVVGGREIPGSFVLHIS
jgi:hypothetical protein